MEDMQIHRLVVFGVGDIDAFVVFIVVEIVPFNIPVVSLGIGLSHRFEILDTESGLFDVLLLFRYGLVVPCQLGLLLFVCEMGLSQGLLLSCQFPLLFFKSVHVYTEFRIPFTVHPDLITHLVGETMHVPQIPRQSFNLLFKLSYVSRGLGHSFGILYM